MIFVERIRGAWPLFLALAAVLGLTVTFANGFLEIADEVADRESRAVDQRLIDWTWSLKQPGLTAFMKGMTELGSVRWLTAGTLASVGILLLRRQLRNAIVIGLGMTATAAMNTALKNAYARARPDEKPIVEATGYSFPSGHAMGILAFCGLLLYLTVKSRLAPGIKGILCAGWILLILLVGWSRVYLGVHYPTDVAAGYAAGAVIVIQCIAVKEAYFYFKRKRDEKAP